MLDMTENDITKATQKIGKIKQQLLDQLPEMLAPGGAAYVEGEILTK